MDGHSLSINAGIQPDHKNSSLLNFENRYPGNFFDGIRDLAEKVTTGGLPTYTFLCGKPGGGKTHLLVGLYRARAFVDDGLIGGDYGLYIPFANLTTEIISTFSDGGSMRISLAKYLPVQYLFLDDISRGEKITDPSRMESQMLRDILLDRWENNRHLICTCNYDPAGLQRMIKNVFGEYVHSRVMGSSLFIEFPDKDFRKEQGEKNVHKPADPEHK